MTDTAPKLKQRADLIIYCVQIYKQVFVSGIMAALHTAKGRAAVIDTLAGALALQVKNHAMSHRLWYDIRNQALCDETFRPVTAEIEAMLVSIGALAFERGGHRAAQQFDACYALLDGVFRCALQNQVNSDGYTTPRLKQLFQSVLAQVL
ncbi:hypothetical protein OS189_13580 [Sulfitobacter sp. F26169L]|uniref:hypothetical protein n=1 Tax=Sulfitobacter sp. F26169L TaxID=2996015 RepID=UPI002260A92E|nr:hypothetical protein [Sulfitobacter sp. F26169L]MCX7567376.1 hypothetical protein [Sulfitobacter sp. F26169L]